MSGVLLESRPFRPFKSSEEYLYAMKEDLAEWLQMLYPHLRICTENFMDKLETGVALCEHANAVKVQAAEYVQKKQARKLMARSVTGSLAQAQTLIEIADVKFFATAKPGTFFARDNLSNFIRWCRESLQILECLLFESDDLIMRKNEKHVILCLLEVARVGAKFGMLAPMLIQMERQIDREIAADQKKMDKSICQENQNGIEEDETDSEMEDEQPMLMYGPLPQIVTNDLKSLDEMVRDLVEKCTCPTQFPMIRVSEGKYRIGDTKVLIFVRILRNHVMVRVGGGWDTLSHYLDKHDPCRCRSQHRTTHGAKLVNKTGAQDLVGAQVYYDRSAPQNGTPNGTPHSSPNKGSLLGPPMNSLNRSRSRSPSYGGQERRSVSPFLQRKSLAPPSNRSRSPTPSYISTHTTKLSSPQCVTPMGRQADALSSPKKYPITKDGPQSLPCIPTQNGHKPSKNHVAHIQIPADGKLLKSEAVLQVSGDSNTDHSDNASEVSDEGYRSLGIVPDKAKNRTSLYSQNSVEDAEDTERQYSMDYEDDTNDCGLRKTQFSSIIYGESPVVLKPTEKPLSRQSSVEPPNKEAERPQSRRNSIDPERRPSARYMSNERLNERRKSSAERTQIDSPRLKYGSPTKKAPAKSVNNTWNGRQRSSRPSLNIDTFTNPFTRNSATRRSVSAPKYDNNGRRVSQSAATSPTKSTLKEELIEAVKNAEDNDTILKEVRKLLKEYGSMNMLNDRERFEDKANRKRKDSKPENQVSRIPAPISNRV